MPTAICIPDIGTTVDEVRLVRWLKKESELVKRGEPLCEVETDKAVSELESIAEGAVLKLLAEEGSELKQGAVIAYVGSLGEPVPGAAPAETSDGAAPTVASRPAPTRPAPAVPPMVRNLARELGVDLERVTGTGPGGRITRDDVTQAARQQAGEGTTLSANQAVVAKRVARSQREIPPIDLGAYFDLGAVIQKRESLKAAGKRVSFDAFFVGAAAKVMREFAHFRSRFGDGKAEEGQDVNVGIAISKDYDLYTPVIKCADTLSLDAIEAAIGSLREKCDRNALAPDDLKGGTLTVSNLGMYPVHSFSAIIPPDQVAVISVGTTEQRPVVRNGEIEARPMAAVTLSVDHRLVNGREAAEFIARLKAMIEEGQ